MKTDIHSHVLPSIDDGCKDIDDSLKALDQAKKAGVRNIICTPHVNCYKKQDKEKIHELYERLKIEANKRNINLFLGNEVLLTNDMIELLKQDMVFSLADTKYLLVEFKRNENRPFEDIVSLLDEVIDLGYKVILAHPEYYSNYRSISKMKILKQQGILLQMDATSILRKYHSRQVVHFTKKILKEKLIDFISSDIHQTEERNYKNYLRCYRKMKRRYGKKQVTKLFENDSIIEEKLS